MQKGHSTHNPENDALTLPPQLLKQSQDDGISEWERRGGAPIF